MLKKYKDKREEGFTIIEVLIVLAIAGLIILIVFLAVPALQRNSRNSSRRNDVSKVGGSIQEILNNNNGSTAAVTPTTIDDAIGSNLAYYDFTANAPTVDISPGTMPSNDDNVETVQIIGEATCVDPPNGEATATDASPRQFVILFTVETGGGTAKVCQDV